MRVKILWKFTNRENLIKYYKKFESHGVDVEIHKNNKVVTLPHIGKNPPWNLIIYDNFSPEDYIEIMSLERDEFDIYDEIYFKNSFGEEEIN